MSIVPITQTHTQLKWKLPNGELKLISELSDIELGKARKIAALNTDRYYKNYHFFEDLLQEMDNELKERIIKIENQLELLKQTEESI